MLSKRRRHYEKYFKEPTSNSGEPADLGRLGKNEVFFSADSGRPGANRLKNNKATGTDLIAAEMLKALDDGPIDKLTQLCNEIYNTGYWPKDLKESIFIPIPKKPKATRCQEYRTISIMSQVTKLLLKIVMKVKVEAELDDVQSGFRQGKGTREGLLNLRLIM